ncbi:MAG: DUF1460 domain-containing protein, partial [Sedimentisphaerales bacterium]
SELIKDAVLRDITEEIGRDKTKYLNKAISPSIWRDQEKPLVKYLNSDQIPTKEIMLPYVPVDVFLRNLYRVKEIAVLSLIHENDKNTPIVVSHQAFLIPSVDGYRVRHARSHPVDKVVEESVVDFVERVRKDSRWRVLGFNVVDVVDSL